MWIADNWTDYEVLDCSKGEKLERWDRYLLVRPDPQVIWDTPKKNKGWRQMNGHYHRSKKGGGEWEFFDLPKQWSIQYKDLTFHLKPFNFKHTGLFPEQAVNWDWFSGKIRHAGRPVKVLNLFAYTGGATLAAAAAGASVTHVDASKGMVGWAKENAVSSGLKDAPVRWLVDDCVKFVERETITMRSSWILPPTEEDPKAKFGKLKTPSMLLLSCVRISCLISPCSSLLIPTLPVWLRRCLPICLLQN